MEDMIPAGDVDVGDVIMLPGADEAALVRTVRLGGGRLIFTLTSATGDSAEEAKVGRGPTEGRGCRRGGARASSSAPRDGLANPQQVTAIPGGSGESAGLLW